MTNLAERKTKLTFVTSARVRYRGRERAIVVEPNPVDVVVRLQGTRVRYSLSWNTVYERGAIAAADRKLRCSFCGCGKFRRGKCASCGTPRKARRA